MGRRFKGLVLDFAGVLTSNMVETIDMFEARERILPGRFLKAWASMPGQDLYRRLELGEISQSEWNEGFGGLLGTDPGNLMGRVLGDLLPAYDVLKVAREARAAGVRTAVLSNSLLDRLGLPAGSCVFADDTEENLVPALRMGMTVIHALDEQETAARLRQLLGLRPR